MSRQLSRNWTALLVGAIFPLTAITVIPGMAAAQSPPTAPLGAAPQPGTADPRPAIGVAPENTAAPSESTSRLEKPKLRHREGTQVVGRRGRIERRGDRFVFLGGEPAVQWIVLENLALERILRIIETEDSDDVEWTVDGMVTEFRGVNYLLLRRTVVRSAGERASPRRLEPLPPDATTLRGLAPLAPLR